MTKLFVLAWKFANYISSIIFKRLTSFRSGHLSGNIWLWISILKDITQSTLKRVVNLELSSTEHNSFHNSFHDLVSSIPALTPLRRETGNKVFVITRSSRSNHILRRMKTWTFMSSNCSFFCLRFWFYKKIKTHM